MSKIVLFTGGARSGKSTWAERYATMQERPVVYLATAQGGDAEMRQRIAQHRERRPASWPTIEAPLAVAAALHTVAPATVVLLECLTLLVSNILLAHEHDPAPVLEREIAALLALARERALTLIVVTNEVGMGLVPEYPLGRQYRDLIGWATQQIAAQAGEVYLTVAGIVVELRTLQPSWAHKWLQ